MRKTKKLAGDGVTSGNLLNSSKCRYFVDVHPASFATLLHLIG